MASLSFAGATGLIGDAVAGHRLLLGSFEVAAAYLDRRRCGGGGQGAGFLSKSRLEVLLESYRFFFFFSRPGMWRLVLGRVPEREICLTSMIYSSRD